MDGAPQLIGVLAAGDHGLFHQHVQALFQGGHRLRIVQRVWRNQHHAVELGRRLGEHRIVRFILGRVGEVFLPERLGLGRRGIHQRDDLALLDLLKLLGVPVGHSAAADQSEVDHGEKDTMA